jgi:hypothetical protein
MLPRFTKEGTLPPGVHWATWREFAERFAVSPHRRRLLAGLHRALKALRAAGCRTVYLDGSYVTSKPLPLDFDGCWDVEGVEVELLDPVLLEFDRGQAAQKAKYFGELFPAQMGEGGTGLTFLEFFQVHKETGNAKGIVAIDLRRWKR